MDVRWRRTVIAALGAIYVTGAVVLAGFAIERVCADRERMVSVRAREARARETRARVIRIELEQAAGSGVWMR